MVLCSLLAWLALTALILAAFVLRGGALLATSRVTAIAMRLCGRICRYAIVLAFVGGLVLGLWACLCGPMLARALSGAAPCLRWLVVVLLLLVVVLVSLVLLVAACHTAVRFPSIPWGKREGQRTHLALRAAAAAPGLTLPVLLVALLLYIADCCGIGLGHVLFGDRCAWLLGFALLLGLIALLLGAIHLRHCREPSRTACARIPYLLLLATLIAAVALVLLIRCCDQLKRKDYDLAMVGVWWEGERPGESGAHLRWAFRYGLPFPQNGFDLYRRESGTSSWTKLNGAPIRPADVWTDGAAAPGPMWQHRAVDRLHPTRWTHFQGQPFVDLQGMLARPPYALLYFVQDPDDSALPLPSSPYTSEADLQAYLATYNAAGTTTHPALPLAQWRVEPMQALMVSALHPDIARLLGLLYIDTTVNPNVRYDYQVVGYWLDGERSYTVEDISKATTKPLAPPQLTKADTPVAYPGPAGILTQDDRSVGLRWVPPTADPQVSLTAADGIGPVRWMPRRKDLGPRPCPVAPAPDGSFLPVQRFDEGGVLEDVSPLALTPEKKADGGLQWPMFFSIDRSVDYRCYAYLLDGIDVFGRVSPTSNVLVADVHDITGPPPPLNIEARVFQREDAEALSGLTPGEMSALFPTVSTHTQVLRVSWVWPSAFLTTVPDAKEFRAYYKISGYETFAQPASQPLWPDPSQWSDSGVAVALAASKPLPARLSAVGVSNAAYYEAIIPNPPMTADDNKPVIYGFAGVVTVDHDPFNNKGPVSPPVVIFSRDFTPPAAPPTPTLQKGPDPTDKGANAIATLGWAADGRYQYHLMRLPGRRLAPVSAPAGPPPSCLAPEAPTCTGTDAACVEAKRRFQQRLKAAAHPELFGTATMAPEGPKPSGTGHEFVHADKVDATEGDDWLYAGRAIDAAGNVSAIGCAQIVVVRDFMPPRPPTVSQALGLEGAIRLTWAGNSEADLHRYRLYRTTEGGRDGSLDRMALVLETDAMGVAIAPPGAANATRAGVGTAYMTFTWTDADAKAVRDYFYRLVAVDQSGNISDLSATARARAFDTTPPSAPPWGASLPLERGTDVTGAFVRVKFATPAGDPEVRFRIQRRDTGTAFWRPISEWLPSGSTEHIDRRVAAGQGYTYRVQAMDPAGNVGEFNEPKSAP